MADRLEAILLNGLTAVGDGRFVNRTVVVGRDPDYLADEDS